MTRLKSQQSYLWIFFWVSLTFLPFMNGRVTRTAGDEKVYVSQAVEMAERGSWFLQTYAQEPNYYKGPFHYIAIRVGMFLFGKTMLATVYMNYALLLIGAWALCALMLRIFPEKPGWAVWCGVAFATCADLFAHAFASQMETELAGTFALGSYFLLRTSRWDRDPKKVCEFAFWMTAGFAGWIKSPLHSLLLGFSGILFWILDGSLPARIRSLKSWLSAISGILICCSGYAPAFFWDREAFINTYYLRETMFKPANGGPWYQALIPIFSYSIAPWTLIFWLSVFGSFRLLRKNTKALRARTGLRIAIAIAVPTCAFFVYHPYRGDNYCLPMLSAFFIVSGIGICQANMKSLRRFQSVLWLTAGILMLASLAVFSIYARLDPLPTWLPRSSPFLLFLSAAMMTHAAAGLRRDQGQKKHSPLIAPWCVALLGVGGILLAFGEREMDSLRRKISELESKNESVTISYSNLSKNIWSEWGYLGFAIHRDVHGIHREDELQTAIRDRHLILLREDWALQHLLETAANMGIQKDRLEITPWKRWQRHAKDANGNPALKRIWLERSLRPLEGDYFMVRLVSG